jgi:hypothetical protein
MKITRFALPALLALGSCATPDTYQSHWILYPRSSAEAKEIAAKALRELGYAPASVPGNGNALEGRYTEGGRVIRQQVEIRPAGAECEVQVSTAGEVPETEQQRLRNAHERLVGGLDAAMHK